MREFKKIGDAGNYYGGVVVTSVNNKYYWCIENYDGYDSWEEIPKELYDSLCAFEDFKDNSEKRDEYGFRKLKLIDYSELFPE